MYCVYLLECSDGSIYTGITKDIQRRLQQHNAGTASKYTRPRRPVTLIMSTGLYFSSSEALKIEYSIKQLHKTEKRLALEKINLKKAEISVDENLVSM
jgi:putative endonuclease